MKRVFQWRGQMALVLGAMAAVAEVAVGPAVAQRPDRLVDPPISRSFNWFAYVGGDDIRANCGRDGRDRVRLVYNARYTDQVRTYELFLQPDGTTGMTVGVLADQGNVSNLVIAQPADVLKPWSMKRGERILTPVETRELVDLLQASAAFGPPRDGLRLADVDFWWTVASCRAGTWGFQAYHFPTDGFANARFAPRLFALDPLAAAVPVNPPRKQLPAELQRDINAPVNHMRANQWTLTVGRDGLRR